jgi:manganese-dependent inorganic pyrophosphatase
MSQQPVYIFGHKNPDADAICSAIAYQALKHAMGESQYMAVRCGNTNARIDAILSRFNIPLPAFIGDVTPRLEHIMKRAVHCVSTQSTCAEALEIIDRYDIRALPVVDDDNRLEGILSFFQLGEFFIPKPKAPREMRHVVTSVGSIIKALNAEVLNAVEPDRIQDLYVRVGAMDIRSFGKFHIDESVPADQSVIVVGDRWDIQERSLQLKVRLLVITGNLSVDEEVIARAKERGVSLVVSPYDSASTSFIIRTANRINGLVQKAASDFAIDDTVRSVKRRIANIAAPIYCVIDNNKVLQGVFSKSDLLRPSKTQIVLVDHNELSQAVTGADEVNILEIIDHHRLGNCTTDQPILFVNRPLGSTCTIVADLFRAQKIEPEPAIAGVMMAGIISDTLHLNSPTSTTVDADILKWLAPIAGIESAELAELIFSSGSIIISQEPNEVIQSDCKIYDDGDVRYSVSQVEELGFDNFWQQLNPLRNALEAYRDNNDLLFSLLFVTDINSQDSLLVYSGIKELAQQISFPASHAEFIFELKGIVSRKKQLIPYISTLLKTSGGSSDQ